MVELKLKNNLVLIVGTIIAVYLLLGLTFFKGYMTDYVNDNFREMRCYPHVIPFAGLSKSAPGNSFFDKTFRNFSSCGTTFIQKFTWKGISVSYIFCHFLFTVIFTR